MFKELKVIKLLVLVGLLFVIILKLDFYNLLINKLYLDKPSYYPGDKVKLYSSTNSGFSFNKDIFITDFLGNVVDKIQIQLSKQETTTTDVLSEGLNYQKFQTYSIPDNIQSGVYLINNNIPLIVKSREKTDITVVYPYMNNVLYESENTKSVLSENKPKASLNRTGYLDEFSQGMDAIFSKKGYNVSYISDLDIEEYSNFSESKLLVLYGKSIFWTPKMRKSLTNFLNGGGNLLLATSYTINDVCWYNENEHSIILFDPKERNSIQTWNSYSSLPPEKTVGSSYVFGGYSNDKLYQIVNKDHAVFKEVKDVTINLKANLYNSPPVIWNGETPHINLDSINFYKGEILAFSRASYHKNDKGIKGVFVLQPDSTSGKIINLGSEDWFLKENISKKELRLILHNSIKYLLN